MTPEAQMWAVVSAIKVLDAPTIQLTVHCRDCHAVEGEHLGWVDEVWVGCVCPAMGFACDCKSFKPGTSDEAQRSAAIEGLRELRQHLVEVRTLAKNPPALALVEATE